LEKLKKKLGKILGSFENVAPGFQNTVFGKVTYTCEKTSWIVCCMECRRAIQLDLCTICTARSLAKLALSVYWKFPPAAFSVDIIQPYRHLHGLFSLLVTHTHTHTQPFYC